MNKCDKCNKNVTKRSPGLICSRCEKLVHANTLCTGLSNKQLTALRAADNLEWTCIECHRESPRRRSYVVPEEEGEEDEINSQEPPIQIDVKQLLKDISKEMEKAIKREMKEITQSLQFHSEKMDEVLENIEAFKETIQELKRKNNDLQNKNTNLETRVRALEQQYQATEQQKLKNLVEIANIPYLENEDIASMVNTVAMKLQVPNNEIVFAERLPGKKERPGSVQVQLKDEKTQLKWLTAAKNKNIHISDVTPGVPTTSASEKIFIRESLTSYNKTLLWNAKQELKNTYKFIWCKKGIIRVRKDEKDTIHTLRSLEDINKLKL